MIETIINSEAFLIVISGVLIFVIQKIISNIWIAPNLVFNKSLTKIETLMVKCKGVYRWTYRKNNLNSSTGLTMDVEIENLRKEINLTTWKLISSFNSLFFIEKWWLKLIGINVSKAKPALLALSVIICSKDDWKEKDGVAKSEKKIDEIYKYLKFKKYFIEI